MKREAAEPNENGEWRIANSEIGANDLQFAIRHSAFAISSVLLALTLVLIAVGLGSYSLYTHRRDQNTKQLLQRARQSAADHDWNTASVAYRQYLQREPLDVAVLNGYADVLLERMKTEPEVVGDAVRTLRRLVGMEPDNAAALGKLTGLYLRLREYGLAKEPATSWVAINPESPEAALSLARAQYGLGKPQEAVDTLVAAIDRNPGAPELYPLLVRLTAFDLNQKDEAAQWLQKALELGSDAHDLQLAAFLLHQSRGNVSEAEEHLDRALNLAPRSLDTLLPAVMFYLSSDRLDEAEALLD
ncbi:MAG: tetratricopeptide repeat protein, partial [Phycisphaerae bacterium]